MNNSKTEKANYVRSQTQTRDHICHWPGCNKQVPPAMWGCKAHWFKLPLPLRNAIWAAYVPGQEIRCPSCNGISSDPNKCDVSEKCNWASYGLFGTMGKGAYVFIKSELRGQEIFMPVSWEKREAA